MRYYISIILTFNSSIRSIYMIPHSILLSKYREFIHLFWAE